MANFASGSWVQNYGPVNYGAPSAFSKAVTVALPNTVATNVGVTEGSDLATFNTPDAGMYRILVYIAVNVASDAGTETVAPIMSFTDAVGAKSNQPVATGATQLTINGKTAGAQAGWVGLCRSLAAGTIAVKLQTVIGTSIRTVGSYNWSVVVEKIGE